MSIQVKFGNLETYVSAECHSEAKKKAGEFLQYLLSREDTEQVLGWREPKISVISLEVIKEKAKQVREDAEVFVVVGVGGSNQAARAMIEALTRRSGPEIIYLGNTLSPHYISAMLSRLEGKRVYINVIAKNFETLEPGSHFRILRQWMKMHYTKEEMAERIIITGTKGSRLEGIAKENRYLFLQFPAAVGGRFSAFTPVGLFPMAVAGLDVDAYLSGMEDAAEDCKENPRDNPATAYAAARNSLYRMGYDIEMLVSFEPQYAYLTRWWVQLFGESEGKDKRGIFPAAAIYSEDLHSIGQYMQEGRRNLIETFLTVKNPKASVVIEPDTRFCDGFDYLDHMDFDRINKVAELATWEAHIKGGVPCIRFEIEEISEKTFGELYYYFMIACVASALLMGVNPFDQEGVEAYKKSMFAALGKQGV